MQNEESTQIVTLKQLPIVIDSITEKGKEIARRIKEMDLDNLIVNEDTRKSIKKLEAELNKEFEMYEKQRKDVFAKLDEPKKKILEAYKSQIQTPIKDGVEILKTKRIEVENGILKQKDEEVEDYFKELLIAENIDFITYEKYKEVKDVKILLSNTPLSYKKQINTFIETVKTDIEVIEIEKYAAEIMTEYKATLNCSQSIISVKSRKQKEAEQELQLKKKEWSRRVGVIVSLGLKLNDDKTIYTYKETDINIVWDDIKDISRIEFESHMIGIEKRIKDLTPTVSKPVVEEEMPKATPPIAEPKEVKEQPVELPPEPVVEDDVSVSFCIVDKLSKIKQVKHFMKVNNINFKAI